LYILGFLLLLEFLLVSSNITLLVVVVLLALSLVLYLRARTKQAGPAVNSLLTHRKKRVINADTKAVIMIDAASAHQHERKVKEEEDIEHVLPAGFYELSLTKTLKPDIKQKIKASIQTIRKPHPLLHKLTTIDPDPKKLYEIIRTDPELVAKVINVANSPLFGLSKPITNVNHAVVYLGVIQVKNIATHFALQEAISFENETQKRAYEKIWSASYLASSIALFVGKDLGFDNPAELSTRCQLSYLGDISIIFAQANTSNLYLKNSSLFERIMQSQKLIGADAAMVGELLASQWRLPQSLTDGIAHSLLPFTNQFDEFELSQEQIQAILLCYFCCRIADSIIFSNSETVLSNKEFTYEKHGLAEFYYFEEQLKLHKLDRLLTLISSAHFKTRLMNIVYEAAVDRESATKVDLH
jgi:HD-like signal output (HDOD) protein